MKKITKRLWEKKNSKKGFTLVELIVVLVILAILAALMVPALTGWIKRAKDKEIALEARTVYLAAQTIASEDYAKTKGARENFTVENGKIMASNTGIGVIQTLAEVGSAGTLSVTVDDSYKVTDIVYKSSASGYTATFGSTGWKYDEPTS